jgi:hypothetical protein
MGTADGRPGWARFASSNMTVVSGSLPASLGPRGGRTAGSRFHVAAYVLLCAADLLAIVGRFFRILQYVNVWLIYWDTEGDESERSIV